MSAQPHFRARNEVPEVIRVARARLAALESEPKIESGQFEFRGAAAELLECGDPEVLIVGPAGTGKSLACFYKVHRTALTKRRSRCLVLRKTRASLTTTGLVTFEDQVLGPTHPLVVNGPHRGGRQEYRYPNGSEVVVGGMDKPEKVLSGDYDLIFVQQAEELSENDWEILGTRLRHGMTAYHQIIGDCNPSTSSHWLKRRCDSGATKMLLSRHHDNPRLWSGKDWTAEGSSYVLGRLGKLTGVRADRMLRGLWVSAEGMVYGDEWDASVHLVDRFPIPESWLRVVTVDFGFTNPFCCQWWAVDGDGRAFRYRELYRAQRLVKDHAEQMRKLSEGEKIEATIADPEDAEGRATLHSCGIQTIPAYKAVLSGIEAVKLRLRPAGDGRPRLFLMRDSVVDPDPVLVESGLPWCTEQEVEAYCWAKTADGKPNKEEPQKANDHGMDAMRYLVAHLDGLGNSSAAWIGAMGALARRAPVAQPPGERAAVPTPLDEAAWGTRPHRRRA